MASENLTGRSLKPHQQIGIGHVMKFFAIVGSALVESKCHVARTHHLRGEPGSFVPIAVLWLVVLLAINEVGVGFFRTGSPKSLKSTSTVMISLLIGSGYHLSPTLTSLVSRSSRLLPNNINDGRLDSVF